MSRSNDQPLKDILKKYIEAPHLKQKILQIRVANSWEKLMGKAITKYTENIYLKDKTLILSLSSSSLKQELGYAKEHIIRRINEELGENAIEAVILK